MLNGLYLLLLMKLLVVVTVLDDDRVGREMANSTRAINIGVNKKTVEWLRKNGYPSLSIKKVQEIDPSTGEIRIEIDSILAEVGAEGLWKWIKYEIEKLAPLDLRKSIDMPANKVPYAKEIADSFTYVNNYADLVTSHTRGEIGKELSESDELYDVDAKEEAIKEELSSKLAEDEGMKMLAEELPKMIKQLKEFVEKK